MGRDRRRNRLALALLILAVTLGGVRAQPAQTPAQQSPPAPSLTPAAGEWRAYGGDLANTKYSPLDQITADNFGTLRVAWRVKSPDHSLSLTLPGGGELVASSRVVFDRLKVLDPKRWRDNEAPYVGNFKATPLMVGGRLYLNAPTSVGAALDARTGETIWVYNPKSYEKGTTTMSARWNQRGVAYWTDGKEERVYWGTGDGYLLAVDARTGAPVTSFGDQGRVDLMQGLPRAERGARDWLNALTYSVQSPPIVIRDTIVTPASISSLNVLKEQIPGWTRGWDVRTGKLKWTFHTIPRPGEFGNETWLDDSWSYTGKVSGWTVFSADEELGYLYLPLNTAAPDYYGGHRPGDGLFAESLVCLDAATGKRVWHYQFVHHGLWDYDLPAAPNLLDITVGGKRIKAVAQITKQGFVFTFDRVTGQPIWPIEERPVGKSDVPGERPSPTQPFPTRPAPFEYQGRRDRRSRGLHAGDPRDGRAGGEELPAGAALHAALAHSEGRGRRDARAAEHRGRRELVRRRGRSGAGHSVRAVAEPDGHPPADPAATGAEEHAADDGSARCRSCVSLDAAGIAALQASVFADDRHRHEHRGASVDGAPRQRRQRAAAPAPSRPEPAAGRRRQHHERSAADEDAAHQRADARRHEAAGLVSSPATRRRAVRSRRWTCPASPSERR